MITVKLFDEILSLEALAEPQSAEDVGMRRCYCINTTTLLTPGSYFLRRNPRCFTVTGQGFDMLL